jgi:hypothetical protein
MIAEAYPDLDIRTLAARALADADRAAMHVLFDACYRQANHGYLEKSLGKLRHVALAWHGADLAGFALADHRVMDLPRLPRTQVNLAGMSCIDPAFRRRHLFLALERAATLAGGVVIPAGVRVLGCGRMAHPASFRGMTRNPTAVPRRGIEPTPWQREVGAAIADAYGVASFDPHTFVCHGTGVPIGYPVVEMGDVHPDEWDVFREVDRDRGDSLLGIAWMPDAPKEWDARDA